MNRFELICRVAVVLFVSVGLPSTTGASSLGWLRQFGTTANDAAYGISVDGMGDIYVTGGTFGSLAAPNAGNQDVFVAKYNTSGALQWTRQIGTNVDDISYNVAADNLGNVFLTGASFGSLGGPSKGQYDAIVMKYNGAGDLQWSRQLGTLFFDRSIGISADGLGNVYIAGDTAGNLAAPVGGSYDAFIAKYNASGALQWTRQIGSTDLDYGDAVAADGLGSVYLAGHTFGSIGGANTLPGFDAFLAKYDASGNLGWVRQIGNSTDDTFLGVVTDKNGNIFASGSTSGTFGGPNAGGVDSFLARYDQSGNLIWLKQFGTSGDDYGQSVSVDNLGNVYVSGPTSGAMGSPNAGRYDAYVAKFDIAGNLLWTLSFGTSADDIPNGLAADAFGGVYLAGETKGSLGGALIGQKDAFVASIPEPSCFVLAATALGMVLAAKRIRAFQG